MSPNTARIPVATLEQLRRKFEALPPKPKADYSRQETVRELETLIRHAVTALGYSVTDIAAIYSELGAEISASTISSILRDLAPKSAAKKKKTTQRGQVTSLNQNTDMPARSETPETAHQGPTSESEADDAARDAYLVKTHFPPDLK